jgi:hypothetical protein
MDEQSDQKNHAFTMVAPPAAEHPSDEDLSRKIEKVVEREPLDLVKCVRVFGIYYRCNWWSRNGDGRTRPANDWTGIIVDSVRKSCFLSATMNAGELVVKEIDPVSGHRKHLVRET